MSKIPTRTTENGILLPYCFTCQFLHVLAWQISCMVHWIGMVSTQPVLSGIVLILFYDDHSFDVGIEKDRDIISSSARLKIFSFWRLVLWYWNEYSWCLFCVVWRVKFMVYHKFLIVIKIRELIRMKVGLGVIVTKLLECIIVCGQTQSIL